MSLIQHASNTTETELFGGRRESDARKRKRDETATIAGQKELGRETFSIRPDSTDPFGLPRTFTPVCLLSRVHLPLAYLDTQAAGSNRLFSARISALEALRETDDEVPSVLVVEDEREGRLYATESAGGSTYALCQLGVWVKKDVLTREADNVVEKSATRKKRKVEVGRDGPLEPWWQSAAVEMPDLTNGAGDAWRRLSMLPMEAMNPGETTRGSVQSEMHAVSEPVLPAEGEAPLPTVATPLTVIDVLQELAKQYQEALYLSRTSLAYFAKGPLSRARAAFTTSEAGLDPAELTSFLRESLLTASALDKKYRDGLSGMVKDFPSAGLETPEQVIKTKRKRKWKAKRDKHGLFSDEKDFIEKWWRSQDDPSSPTGSVETLDGLLKSQLPRLRSRETYLQVMVALEVLALEASLPKDSDTQQPSAPVELDTQLDDTQLDDTQQPEPQLPKDGKKSRTKKQHDLAALLEVLLDRLCIWHSLESSSPTKASTSESKNGSYDKSDELRSFCIEVVMPFYMSRIPEYAKTVNKKLGGPSAHTPVKRKTTSFRKPGEPATRPVPEQKPRKPLSRVSSAAIFHSSRHMPPSLHRSATDSEVLQHHLKRENSEAPVPLDSIPALDKPPVPRKRTSLMHSISFSRREVDLSAMSQANEKKMRKKAEVEEKLKEAISTLKKPNRIAAVKEVADEAERRNGNGPASRKTGVNVSRVGKLDVPHERDAAFVAATPKHTRIVKGTPWRGGQHNEGRTSARNTSSLPIPPSSSVVPSSSARLQTARPTTTAARDAVDKSTFAVPQTGHRPRHTTYDTESRHGIMETPSRGFAKYMPVGLGREPGTLDSPLMARRQFQETPVKAMKPFSLAPPARPGSAALVEASPNPVRAASPPRADLGTKRSSDDIYAALGWDDDEEYEALA